MTLTRTVLALDAPPWTRDLVIYEIATKSFTSPEGPESGTFEGLRSKLPYLQNLGITGIWLTGHSLADSKHFFNVWTQYADIEPDSIDPSLGTPEQFKRMIDEAHRLGIKVFLDVITHGVMRESSLIKRHPEWFRGGTYGMVDYDWNGGHTDLDEWWVKLWSDAVTRYGVDGYRLDVAIYRPDLWARVRGNAAAAGHPIVIFEEHNAALDGVTDFCEQDQLIDPKKALDVPAYYAQKFGRKGTYRVRILYMDGTSEAGDTDGAGPLKVKLNGLIADKVSRRMGDGVGQRNFPDGNPAVSGVMFADGITDISLGLEGVRDTSIENIVVTSDLGAWTSHPDTWERALRIEGKAPTLTVYLATLSQGFPAVQLSEHSSEGYVARGSRAVFGYGFLFASAIPLWMAGDEFDADFHPLPGLTVDLLGHSEPGKGHLLYGAMLDWNELIQQRHRSMLDDVRRMLSLRKSESELLGTSMRAGVEPNLAQVPYRSDIDVPPPYIRWHDGVGIVILANRNASADAHLILRLPLELLGRAPSDDTERLYSVTDLWNGGRSRKYSARELANFAYTVKRDRIARGGLGVLKISFRER